MALLIGCAGLSRRLISITGFRDIAFCSWRDVFDVFGRFVLFHVAESGGSTHDSIDSIAPSVPGKRSTSAGSKFSCSYVYVFVGSQFIDYFRGLFQALLPFGLTLTELLLGIRARMQNLDTSLAMFPEEGLPDFCYQGSRQPPPAKSHQCPSCRSLYYEDTEGCLRVIPGPGPELAGFDGWITNVEKIYFRSGSCTICRLLYSLIAGVAGHCEKIWLHTLSDGSCLARAMQSCFHGRLIPERKLRKPHHIILGTKTSRPHLIDPYMIREWIKTCKTTHTPGDNPVRMSRLNNSIDITLIDVMDQRLIHGSSSMTFCALSYVWGDVKGFRTTSANRAALESPGSLQQPQVRSQIPQVIKDAMQLVSLIGERFLWVDALCIQQDNAAMKHSQIMQMNIIYGHAMLTIVNLSGKSADEPLPRVPSEAETLAGTISTGESLRKRTGQSHEAGLVPIGLGLGTTITESPHNTRAWTFQERLLSPRCLFLGENQCFFLCHSHFQAEISCPRGLDYALDILPNWNDGPAAWFVDLSPHCHPEHVYKSSVHFRHFYQLLMAYRHKKLSWESDALNAFSGILAALTEQNGWTFLSGLPEQHLEFGLLWMPEVSEQISRIEGFPTWSWAAWKCVPTWDQDLYFALPFSLAQGGRTEIADLQTFRQTPRRPITRKPIVPTGNSSPLDARAALHVLAFHAYTVPYKSFGLSHPIYERAQNILDSEGRSCGVCSGSSRAIEGTNRVIDIQMDIILLSRFERKSPRQSTHHSYSNSMFHQPKYPFSKWAFLNVMFIRWEGGYAERVCVGVLHERAFMNAGPTWKEIFLV